MRISTLFYVIGQGFRNLTRNRWYTLASVATISACLFLFGMFYAIVQNFQNIVTEAEKGVSVTVFFGEDVTEDMILVIKAALEKRPEVERIEYISAEAAWEEFKVDYLKEYADGFTENPLEDSASLAIYLNDVSMQPALVTYLESLPDVRKVNRSEMTASMLSGMNRLIAAISLGIILVLLLVSIFLISNTVRFGISVRREEINIMKYIGATDFFVRAPFVIESILIGIIGSMIPLVVTYFLYNQVILYVHNHFSILSSLLTFLPVEQVMDKLVPATVLIGVGIGLIGSITTVRRHLHV
ncbi:MAG: permease-like cell division protein FtsX [Butyrivibrio sp.]|nr:permease-like cell division protein FtsX [Butyrivibrio sp.]